MAAGFHTPEDLPKGSALQNVFHIVVSYYYLVLPLCLVLHLLKERYLSPLRQYPGPLLASCTRLWKVLSVASGHCELDRIRIHQKYGPIVRIAPNELSFSSPIAARDVLTAGKGFHKTDFYGVFPPPENPDIFTEVREDVHAQKKRVAAVPYSMAAMQKISPFVDDTVHLFMSKLNKFASNPDQSVDLGNWLHYFAFDVLGQVAFSRNFGFLDAGFDLDNTIKWIDDQQWYDGIVGQVPFMDFVLRRNPLWQFVPALATKNSLITRMALQEMDRRKPFDETAGRDKDREDLLSQLIRGHLSSPDKFGEGDVFAVAHGAIFAGSDSTASTMQSFFFHVLKDPAVYRKLCDEVDEAVKSGQLSPICQWNESQNLSYFQACLNEAMRVRPAVGLDITRVVPPGGAEINGTKFPGGTRVALNAWPLHLDKGVFGADAAIYRPERWLEDKEKAKTMNRYMFQFGGGSHLCIGRNLALMEMNKVLPHLIRDYHFQLVHPERPIKYNTTFFVVQQGLEVYMRRRNQKESKSTE